MPNIDVSKIPSVDALRPRFAFIHSQSLQTNVCIAFQYIIFQITLLKDEGELQGPIRYSLYKSTILYTASIVEACLHYCIWNLIEKEKLISTDIMPFEWKNTEKLKFIEINDHERVFGISQRKSQDKLKTSTQFHELNKAAKNARIFTEEIFKKSEWLRDQRNQIHIVGLENKSDAFPDEKDIEKAFGYARDIIEVLEKQCSV
jgi:hypothetical protein